MDKKLLLILAAGKSSRMGYPKGLVKYKNEYLIEHQIKSFFALGGRRVLIILGSHLELYEKELNWAQSAINSWTSFAEGMVQIIVNDSVDRGQFFSFQLGVRASEQMFSHIYLLPVDVPFPDDLVWKSLDENIGDLKVAIPQFEESGGHPILIKRSFAEKLSLIDWSESSSRLDYQIKELPEKDLAIVTVQDRGIVANVNFPEDL